MIPLIGFAPDLPPETAGVITACDLIVPTTAGFKAAPSAVLSSADALAAAAQGFSIIRKPDSTRRVFAGTSTKLYELSSTTWTDVSRVGDYSIGTEARWTFAQFGNVTLASAKDTIIQASTTGDFADVDATAPKARVIETVNNFVFAFATNEATYGDDPIRWWCSALGDETDWTPSIATQCVTGQFLDTPGAIVGGKKLGNYIVAFKKSAMYLGQYVGAPEIWDWQKLPGEIGTPSHQSIVSIGTALYFVGDDDFYVFDGSRAIPLQAPVRQWFFDNLDPQYSYRIWGTFDRQNALIYWWFSSKTGSGTLDKCLVYHIKKNQWGCNDSTIEATAEYIEPGITYESIGSVYSTYDSLPTDISYDSPFWNAESQVLAAFNTSHQLVTFTGTPGTTSLMLGHYGDQFTFTTCTRVRPRFLTTPSSSTMLYSYSNENADDMTQNITSNYLNGFYDMLWSARWHKFELQFNGETEITGIDFQFAADGTE